MTTTTTTDTPPSKLARKRPAMDIGALNDHNHYPDIDLAKALTCAEFSRLCYRRTYEAASPKSVHFQQEEKSKIAEQFAYKAKVLSSADQQCVIFYNDRDVIVAFEGSRVLRASHYWRNVASWVFAWFTPAPDVITEKAREITGDKHAVAKVHFGFDNALNAPLVGDNPSLKGTSLWEGIRDSCAALHRENPKRKIYFTGHSAGGAIATIATARLLNDLPDIPKEDIGGLYTFGQPRMGGKYFKAGFEHLLGRDDTTGREKYFRFEQYGDPMPALPPYHPEQYVPVGRWIPMDLDGHLLKKEQFKDAQPTLIEADPALFQKIEDGYSSAQPLLGRLGRALSFAANGSVTFSARLIKDYVLPQKLLDSNPELERSYSSLQNLFSARNFTEAHKIRNYSAAIQKHIDQHSLPDQKPDMQFLHGQLMSCVNEAADLIQHVALADTTVSEKLSPELNTSMQRGLPSINHLMRECEMLMKMKLPDQITAPIPEHRRAWNLMRTSDWFVPYWHSPISDETLDAQAIQKTLTKALQNADGALNRSSQIVKRGEALTRLQSVGELFGEIKHAITDQDRKAMTTGREDMRSLPFLIDSVVELCAQMETAMKQQPTKSAGLGR